MDTDPDKLMRTANDLLKRAVNDGVLPGLLALLTAAARFAERSGVARDTVHALLDVAYMTSADVGADDTAPTFKPRRRANFRRTKVAA